MHEYLKPMVSQLLPALSISSRISGLSHATINISIFIIVSKPNRS
ncbi:extensin precursor [Iris pallida]|uniref:Extensin n=1 Tax=Iris pallida TaxID=29817 RepID=A0AAX6HHK4_IRIPA|nr:extensin precursor [Iris pallida]